MPLAVTVTTPPLPTQLTPGDPAGSIIGASPAEPLGFFGTAPIVQPGSQGSLRGQTGTVTEYGTSLSPASVAANTTAEQTFTVTGLAVGQAVNVTKPTSQAGLAIVGARVTATNTLGITFANATASPITPTAAETYVTTAFPANMLLTAVLTPAAVGANTTAEQQFAVPGLPAGVAVVINKPTAQAGLGIVDARVISAGILGITFANLTGAPITPTAAQSYLIFATPGLQIAATMVQMTAALSPVAVAANTTAEQTFTVAGLAASTIVYVSKPSAQAGLGLGGVRVSAANTLAITFINDTAASITPTPETYIIAYFPTTAPTATNSVATNATLGGGAYGALVALGLIAGP